MPPIDRPARVRVGLAASLVPVLILLLMAWQAVGSLRDEMLVHGEIQARDQQAAGAPALDPAAVLAPSELPARAALIEGLIQARMAARLSGALRARRLASAHLFLARAMGARPEWGEAWVVAAYIALLEQGAAAPETRTAFAHSLRAAPYLYDSAPWRISYGLQFWPLLDTETRTRIVREAVWLGRLGPTNAKMVGAMVSGTPAAQAYDAGLAAVRSAAAGE